MKKLVLIVTTVLMVVGMTTNVIAQSSATKTQEAGAKIVTALTLSSDQRLDFGTMSIPNAQVDLVMSTINATRTPSAPTAIALMAGTAKNARYQVTGTAGYNYTITLPGNEAVKISASGATDMKVIDFKSLVGTNTTDGIHGTIGNDGTDSFVVGATLQLKSGQEVGVYVGNFDVTVTYD